MSVDLTTILKHYGEVTLCVDLMYVNKVPLLVTLSRNIKFGTVEAVSDRKEATILKCVKGVVSLYRKAGFKVTTTLMDGEFVPLRSGLAELGLRLNETSRDEHVGDIERYIRTVKERMRAIYNTLPFQKIPARLVIEMAKTAVFWLNAFPAAGGASQDLSPCTILTGQQVDYKHHCRFQFGEYTQTHEENNNSMNPRTVGAIALRPVGNGQGSYYFLSVTTGRVLNRLHATALPMPDEVIDKLHRMARQQKSNPGLIFADRNLNPDEYDDEEDEETYHEGDSISDDEDDVLSDDEEDDDKVVEDDEEAEEDDDEVVEDDEEAENPLDNEENDADEVEDEPQAPQAEENDAAAMPPPVENDEEANSVDLMAEVEAMEPAEAGPPEDPVNHEAEFPEVPETPGVGRAGEHEEEAWLNDPETPGVGGAGQHQEEAKDQAPAPRYNLRKTRGRDYDH